MKISRKLKLFSFPKAFEDVGKIVSFDEVKVRIFSPQDIEKLKEKNFSDFREFLTRGFPKIKPKIKKKRIR